MSKINKIGLFLSAFVPLFLLLIIKELIEIINENWSFNFLNTFLIFTLFLLNIWGIISLLKLVNNINNYNGKSIKIISKKNITDQHFLGYFSLFVLFAVSFEIEMYSMAFVFILVVILIAVVYIKNDMYFINPLLNIIGYSFYKIEYTIGENTYCASVFFNGRLEVGNEYVICDKYSNLFFLKNR